MDKKATFELSKIPSSGYYVEMNYGEEIIVLQYFRTAKEAIERAEHIAQLVWNIIITEVE